MKCTEEQACALRDQNRPNKIFFDFDNWTFRYGLYCDKAAYRANCKTFLLVLNTIICLILLVSADIIGRRKLMMVASVLVIVGISITALSPDFGLKMAGLGLVSGGEGTFSALFTIYINENTMRSTKLRSSLISLCFLSYAIGCIFLNSIAYLTTNPNILALIVAASLIVSVVPAFFSYYETPYFLLKKGRISDLFRTLINIYKYNQGKQGVDDTLLIGVENKLLEMMGFGIHITQKTFFKSSVVQFIKKRNKEYSHTNTIGRLCCNGRYVYHVLTLMLIGGLLYCLFYGMSINIQDLGLKDLKLNGILLGATQAAGYLGVAPFTHRMRRKKWCIVFQVLLLLGAVILSVLSKETQTSLVQFEQTITSTCLMATIMSAIFPIFFIYITEIFPTEVRGTANAIVLFMAKLAGSLAPILESFSVSLGFHILVGCSVIVLASLPMTFFMRETLLEK